MAIDAHAIVAALRLVSAALLLAIVAVIFLALWGDHQRVTQVANAQRRLYGRLVLINQEQLAASRAALADYPLLALTTLGRGSGNTIAIDDDFASARHALLALRSGRWWLEDRGSHNGTYLNGVIVTRPVVVTDGDEITVGGHHFRLAIEA